MKNIKNISIVVSLLLSLTAFAGPGEIGSARIHELTGNTIGASATQLSSIDRYLESIIEPEQNLGKLGFFDGAKLSKFVCNNLGSAAAGAFAIQTNLRFYTPGFFAVENAPQDVKDIVNQNVLLIDRLTNTQNEYCAGDSNDLQKVRKEVYRALKITKEMQRTLDKLEGR